MHEGKVIIEFDCSENGNHIEAQKAVVGVNAVDCLGEIEKILRRRIKSCDDEGRSEGLNEALDVIRDTREEWRIPDFED